MLSLARKPALGTDASGDVVGVDKPPKGQDLERDLRHEAASGWTRPRKAKKALSVGGNTEKRPEEALVPKLNVLRP